MSERHVLDFYRNDTSRPREEHYLHYSPEGIRILSTAEHLRRTAGLANGLERLGVTRGDRVMLLSDNRPEWHIADLAIADLGAADVPVYGTLTPEQIAYQAQDSGAVAAIVESPEQMAKLLATRKECPDLRHLIQMDGPTADGVVSLDEVIESGDTGDSVDLLWQRAERIAPDDLLTLIYTSGTTGRPKGVMLSHANLVRNVLPSGTRAPVGESDVTLEFLPLCHVFERMLGYLYMACATTRAYCSVYHVGDLIAQIRPTIFAGVPRFYEKVYDKIMGKVNAASPLRRALFGWATGVGRKVIPIRLEGGSPSGLLGLQHALADRLVLSKVREGLGGRVRYAVSGGAPLPLFVNELFQSMGVWILEGYGLTETSPVIAVNGAEPGMTRLGTVGRPLDNVETRLASDGELLVRGPSVTKGYWKLDATSSEAFDADGFFRTGDIAEIDPDGFLRITDRKKDLIVTAGGKNVAPQPVENQLKRSPFIDNAVLIGDRRPYIVALLSPNQEQLEPWAEEQGLTFDSFEELTRHPEVLKLLGAAVSEVSDGLARFEQIKRFAVLPVMLSIESGHLTPTLKVKRRIVEKDFADIIAGLYEGTGGD
jgi:long-chain acyl-CoA synthetase